MRKLGEKFSRLNDTVGNVYTEQNDMTTRRGGILVRDVFFRNQRKTDFVYFLDAVHGAIRAKYFEELLHKQKSAT